MIILINYYVINNNKIINYTYMFKNNKVVFNKYHL